MYVMWSVAPTFPMSTVDNLITQIDEISARSEWVPLIECNTRFVYLTVERVKLPQSERNSKADR